MDKTDTILGILFQLGLLLGLVVTVHVTIVELSKVTLDIEKIFILTEAIITAIIIACSSVGCWKMCFSNKDEQAT